MKLKDAQLSDLHMDSAEFDNMMRHALQAPRPVKRKKAQATHSKKRKQKPGKD